MAHFSKRVLIATVAGLAFWSGIVPSALRAGMAEPRLESAKLAIGGGEIDVDFEPAEYQLSRTAILAWIQRSACAVSTYYGRFPVPRYRINVFGVPNRHGVLSGTTWGTGGARSRIILGVDTRSGELDHDWIMTHEMVHLALPSVGAEHHWIEEGIATYVEPIARAEIGNYPVPQVWEDLVAGVPNGMPARGDQGLDRTHTWGRTYWGGAMFCLMAEIDIRRRTNNRFGLADALRGVVTAGGSIEVEWPLVRVFKAADAAVGVAAMTQLYAQMKSRPVAPDLDAIWTSLGVKPVGATVVFDDAAPDSAMRRAITAVSGHAAGCAR